ncbi:dihydrofolate reductase family protein [Caulobacter rhizosphaerae]|jgi:riboflavin biosynthesis pyrimidine reductase|uniref:dihydrofolate reductase family protein n=1 Tax=Caulobacter rhizosphaerae TaxID=2010972 RepID=UPI0013CF77F9|nr:RibD family protein [Caulobacter rhizosphaerae]GGL09853.1 2-hydroxy-3-oxopropionate reductase [Caulobacter rhizosphaerae]
MKPRLICHMASSLDGRILPGRWAPKGAHNTDLYNQLHEDLGGGSWLVGRVTGQEFARGDRYPDSEVELPRSAWLPAKAKAYAIVLDAHGKIVWGRADVGGDPLVVVLTEQVSDAHLAGLRADGIGYVFAGEQEINLATTLEVLNRELGIQRLLLEGGGAANGSFLRAGLVDELSILLEPAIDGRAGAPGLFDGDETAPAVELADITLVEHRRLENGALWLRYNVANP